MTVPLIDPGTGEGTYATVYKVSCPLPPLNPLLTMLDVGALQDY